jgi:hypothetical protein
MSLLNVALHADHVLVCVDSMAAVDGCAGETSKLHALPHLNAVLAGRGHVGVLGMALMLSLEPGRTFDELAVALPSALTAGVEHLIAEGHGQFDGDAPQGVVLAGLSRPLGTMCAFAFSRRNGGPFTAQRIRHALLSPGDCFQADVAPCPRTLEDLEGIAREQAAWMRATHPHVASGGRLLVAEVRGEGVRVFARGALG